MFRYFSIFIYFLFFFAFQVDWNEKIIGIFPKIKIQDKGSYVESDTKVYDEVDCLKI